MGFWDHVSSIADAVKGKTPDLTPVTQLYRSSCAYTSAGITKIDDIVRGTVVEKTKQSLNDEETRLRFTQFATAAAKNAANVAFWEGLKFVPGGGPVGNIILQSLQDAKKSEGGKKEIEDHKNEIKELRAIVQRLEEKVNTSKKSTFAKRRT